MAADRQTRVMLVDDHEIMRDGLREVLQRAGDFEVVGQAGDGAAAVRVAQSLKPDVIIMDVMMPLKNGIDACREITEMLPDTRVLMLTAASEEDAVMEAVAAGATGYLQKYSGKDRLLNTVRDVAQGEYRLPADVIRRVFAGIRGSRVPGSGVRGRGSGEREITASSLAGKEESSRKEDNSGQGKDGPAGAIAQGGNGR